MHSTMNTKIANQLNEIEKKITSSDFLKGKGLGNEIPFYIFDYPPEEEISIRDHIAFLLRRLEEQYKIKVLHINLLEFLVSYLKDRNIYEKSFVKETSEGADNLIKSFKAPLESKNLVKQLNSKYTPSSYELVIISGIGNVYPWIRSHTLLTNLQSIMDKTPLVMFYPGRYDGKSLQLFGKLNNNNYYRAFQLIP